jgi:hypothetical protein
MKKTLVSLAVIMTIAGCSAPSDSTPSPTQVPSPHASVSAKPTEAPTTPSKDNPKPTPQSPAPTSSEAGTPATQFAERWGKRYPSVPEFAILKAANRTCDVIGAAGNGWESDPLVQLALKEGIGAFGLSDNDALEFAQDANQNYCSSVSNPT